MIERVSRGYCFCYLEQFTRGQPRKQVHHWHHMDVNHDCAQAKQLLREHCGYENKITTAYMEKDFALLACKCIIREKMFPKDFH